MITVLIALSFTADPAAAGKFLENGRRVQPGEIAAGRSIAEFADIYEKSQSQQFRTAAAMAVERIAAANATGPSKLSQAEAAECRRVGIEVTKASSFNTALIGVRILRRVPDASCVPPLVQLLADINFGEHTFRRDDKAHLLNPLEDGETILGAITATRSPEARAALAGMQANAKGSMKEMLAAAIDKLDLAPAVK